MCTMYVKCVPNPVVLDAVIGVGYTKYVLLLWILSQRACNGKQMFEMLLFCSKKTLHHELLHEHVMNVCDLLAVSF